MESPAQDTIEQVRNLMPVGTLTMLSRPLTAREARLVAERQANLLLELLGISTPSVAIELIMELPNIEVEVVSDLPQSGQSMWHDNRWLIKISAEDSLWRSRATLAHELKHILDDPFVELLYPAPSTNRGHGRKAEAICEYFAGCVLVPENWLRRAWHQGRRDPAALASLFDVSVALIRVRLKQIGLGWELEPHWSKLQQPYSRKRLSRHRQRQLLDRLAKHSAALLIGGEVHIAEACV